MNICILVNKNHLITKKEMQKIDLIETQNIDNETIQVERNTYQAFQELKKYCESIHIKIGIASAYRDFDYQQRIQEYYKEKKGEDYCNKYVAPIGASEHHTGLAIDFYIEENGSFPEDDLSIAENEKYKEVHKILKDFGFILRYPKGKENITGYEYEAWHIRYVGKVVAKICYENNLTLEEYLSSFRGILVINKPKGITSFDAVHQVSNLFGIKKVGHTGTLDPLAEGVLVVCIGEATKVVELLTANDKEYIAGVKLGIKTDTYDIDGEVLEKKEVPENLPIEEVVSSFQKTYMQEVPIYSAVKVNGKKLYEYARKKETVELPKKEVTIKRIELLEQTKDTFTFKANVTKGCYIRSLINDIGNQLNTYATMTSLIRTKQGKFTLEEAISLEDLEQGNYTIRTIEEALPYKQVVVSNDLSYKIKNGVKLKNDWNVLDKVIFKDQNNKLLGIYEVDNDFLKVWKNFN